MCLSYPELDSGSMLYCVDAKSNSASEYFCHSRAGGNPDLCLLIDRIINSTYRFPL